MSGQDSRLRLKGGLETTAIGKRNEMMQRRLGIGLIGSGMIARFHIQSFLAVRDADIMGIWSPRRKNAQEAADLAQSLGVGPTRTFDSITAMIESRDIDALWILGPNHKRLENMEEIVHAVTTGRGSLLGVACEKPLGRNVAEARRMLELVQQARLLDGYLEDQIFAPTLVRGRDLVWQRGVPGGGRPYLARAAEEHSGPHSSWFWRGDLQGGGVLNDMMCHSVEAGRHLLTPPGKPRDCLRPTRVTAVIACLKWHRPEYAERLARLPEPTPDYRRAPSEDYAHALVEYRDEDDNPLVVEATTSWSFVGPGLRLSMELLGPEYSMRINTLESGLSLFFGRDLKQPEGEDLVEKQNAECGQMPVVPNEAAAYGYEDENRHMVRAFLEGRRPDETFEDGLNVTELLMAAYMSAEQNRAIEFPVPGLQDFVPAVARGTWSP